MIIDTFPVGMLGCNCTILGDEDTGEAIVIDPGDDADLILRRLAAHGLRARQMVCTHTHIDHVGAIHGVQTKMEAPTSIHPADLRLFEHLDEQARFIGMPCPRRGVIETFFHDGDAIACKGVEIGAIHTPGHTPGSSSFLLQADRPILFTGDTLFRQSIGRTDLWGGSYPEILTSIRKKLLSFPDDTLVIAGHGGSTTIGEERRSNPFLR